MRIAPRIVLDAVAQRELTALARRGRVEARVQQRAKAVLLAALGWQNKDIAVEVDLDRRQVALWRQRFLDGGVAALMHDAPRPGRTPSVTAEVESSIWTRRFTTSPSLPRTGARARWPRSSGWGRRPSVVCGSATA